jgi:hypothetical protein
MSERIVIRERRITQPCAERLSSPKGAYLQKMSYARKFKELITHTPTAGGAGGALKAEPRNKTVCFTLSEREKLNLDKLCMSMNITRSGLLSQVLVSFVEAATDSTKEENLLSWVTEAATAHETYGEQTNHPPFSPISPTTSSGTPRKKANT